MYFSSGEGRFPLALEEPPDTALKGASSSSLSEMSNQIDLFGFGGPADVFFFKTAAFLAFDLPPDLVLSWTGTESTEAPGLPSSGAVDGSESSSDLVILADFKIKLPACISIFAP